jgi:hypothetical protein
MDNVQAANTGTRNRARRSLRRWVVGFLWHCLGLFPVHAALADDLILNFSSVPTAKLDFNGSNSTFAFDAATKAGAAYKGFDFNITKSAGATGDSLGLYGKISGTFTVGAITNAGGVQTAAVTSTNGVLDISDGTHDLTASLSWINIKTNGTAGNANTSGAVNLTSITYSGTNQDLLALKADGSASVVLSFSFNPAETLTQLTTDQKHNTTAFSGVLTATQPNSVPEPGAVALLLAGLPALGLCFARRKGR